jgi:hypothetical protein
MTTRPAAYFGAAMEWSQHRRMKIEGAFFKSSGALILMAGLAKLGSSFGNAHILQMSDPILSLSFRSVFRVVGVIELCIGIICFRHRPSILKASLVAWIATSFVAYRLGLLFVEYRKPCQCLGNLTDGIHISPEIADTIMKTILGYLLVGSYVALWFLLRKRGELLTVRSVN